MYELYKNIPLDNLFISLKSRIFKQGIFALLVLKDNNQNIKISIINRINHDVSSIEHKFNT